MPFAAGDPRQSGRPRRRRGSSRSRPWLLAALLVLVLGSGAAAAVSRLESRPSSSTAARPADCTVRVSYDGYPDRYLVRRLKYTIHPPLPVAGWRGPNQHPRFAVLFHSIFHGFVVVEYRPDISAETLAMLRTWVRMNASRRVTSVSARADAPFAVDLAKWGYELSCANESLLTRAKLDRFLALHAPGS